MNKYLKLLIAILIPLLSGCREDKDEPTFSCKDLVGCWAITHINRIVHTGNSHQTYDREIPPHGVDSYAGDINYRYDVLIFDENYVTVRGDMPNRPKGTDYDLNTPDGQIKYIYDLNEWYNRIASYTDQLDCPVGTYSLHGSDLIIGSLNMGQIKFISPLQFTLDYKREIDNGDYERSTYTYSRISSLALNVTTGQ